MTNTTLLTLPYSEFCNRFPQINCFIFHCSSFFPPQLTHKSSVFQITSPSIISWVCSVRGSNRILDVRRKRKCMLLFFHHSSSVWEKDKMKEELKQKEIRT
jgi:hypothetical protein